jgi:aminoglycoside phosphotransferase (APT) family kinase protein
MRGLERARAAVATGLPAGCGGIATHWAARTTRLVAPAQSTEGGQVTTEAGYNTPGLTPGQLGPWFAANIAGAGSDLSAELIAGGKSNLTYLITDGTSSWVLRRPPLGHVLATAHDMSREYRVMMALGGTDVPVPAMLGFCDDTELIGAPFYVMQHIDGTPYRRKEDLTMLGPQRTRTIATGLVDTLALLHSIDPDAIGLGDFGRPDGFLERQVRRWRKQLEASYSRDIAGANELYQSLAASVPPQSPSSIVHGDYRLDNILVGSADQPAAVIDWEMATLGDPLTDLALMFVYHRLGALLGADIVTDTACAPGFLTEDEITARYTAKSGRDLSAFGFYLGLAAYKLSGILEGIYFRHQAGQTVGAGFDSLGGAIDVMIETGLNALKEEQT